MTDKVDYHALCINLRNFCVNCGDNLFTEFVWIQTIKRIQKCDESCAKRIINNFRDTNILIQDGRRLMLNTNVHRNMKFMINT